MKKTSYILLLLVALAMGSCKQVSNEWVDLEATKGLNPRKAFVPFAANVDGDRAEAAIQKQLAILDEAVSCSDTLDERGIRRTTSTNSVGLAKALFSWWHSDISVSYCGTYMSVDENGDSIRLSGRIILPLNGRPKRAVIVSHYTIGASYESPSCSFPLEGILAARGLAVIVPDYIGYGVTSDRVHPYLCSDLTATNVVDMYSAAIPFLESIDKLPEYADIILFGYSQGGATTMAVARKIEQEHPEIDLRLILAGGGPYDICATYDKLIANDFTDYPCALPMIIQGMNVGQNLGLNYADYFLPTTLANMDEWVNSKRYAMAEITELMGTKHISDILTPGARDKVSDGMMNLYMAMLDNSISSGYYPTAPLYLFHSIDDNVVPFENAESLMTSIHGYCNVQYNFGHYGNHVAGYLRFLYTAINYLYEHGEITEKTLL